MGKRIKLIPPAVIDTRADLDVVLEEIRDLTIRRNKVQLDRDQAVAVIDSRTGPALTELDDEIERRTRRVAQWAETHTDVFGSRKSMDTTHAVIGWRVGNPALKCLAGWTWEKVIARIKELPAMAAAYIRPREEVNKETVLADRAVLGKEGLRNIGLRVSQERSFYVAPKLEQVENRQTVAA